jgi:hypothetical protein
VTLFYNCSAWNIVFVTNVYYDIKGRSTINILFYLYYCHSLSLLINILLYSLALSAIVLCTLYYYMIHAGGTRYYGTTVLYNV